MSLLMPEARGNLLGTVPERSNEAPPGTRVGCPQSIRVVSKTGFCVLAAFGENSKRRWNFIKKGHIRKRLQRKLYRINSKIIEQFETKIAHSRLPVPSSEHLQLSRWYLTCTVRHYCSFGGQVHRCRAEKRPEKNASLEGNEALLGLLGPNPRRNDFVSQFSLLSFW